MDREERLGRIERYRQEHAVYERGAALRAPTGAFIGVRCDGRAFHTFTASYEHPFDARIEHALERAAEALMALFTDAACAYLQSDEVTLVLPPACIAYDRRLEKLASVCAATVAAAFSVAIGTQATFDARVLVLPEEEDALAMLAERQQDAVKNAATALAYWTLRRRGASGRAAERRLGPLGMRGRIALLDELGTPFNGLSPERRRGRLVSRQVVPHSGFDPIAGRAVETTRRTLNWDRDMPDLRDIDRLPGIDAIASTRRRKGPIVSVPGQ